MRLVVVIAFPYPRQACYPQITKPNDVRCSEVVNILGHPAAIIELLKVRASFMVAAHENCQIRCHSFTTVVLVEVANGSIFDRN